MSEVFDVRRNLSLSSVSRILGSLLSAHLLIKDSDKPFGSLTPTGYTNELLSLANDLGARLLPAFENSATGLPHPRVSENSEIPFLPTIPHFF